MICWLCVGTVLALFVNWRGGLGPNNKAPDEQYFAWEPSAEAGRQGAVVAFVLTGVAVAIAVVLAWRQGVRDGLVERPSTAGRARAHPTGEIRRHPFPPKPPDAGMADATARER